MRASRLALAGTVILALLGSVGAQAVEPDDDAGPLTGSVESEETQGEVAWATIRDGVFVESDWPVGRTNHLYERLKKKEGRELRRVARDHLALLEDVGSQICYARAFDAAKRAARLLDKASTQTIEGRRMAAFTMQEFLSALSRYWAWRDTVDCSALGSIEALNAIPFTRVTGSRVVASKGDMPTLERRSEGEGDYVDGFTKLEGFEWTDPRLPAAVSSRANAAVFAGLFPALGTETVSSLRLEGPHGDWTGAGYEYLAYTSDIDATSHGIWLLTGHGAYEGMSAILATTIEDWASCEFGCLTVEGAIFAGPLPTMPEPPEPGLGAMLDLGGVAPQPTLAPVPEHTKEPAIAPSSETPQCDARAAPSCRPGRIDDPECCIIP